MDRWWDERSVPVCGWRGRGTVVPRGYTRVSSSVPRAAENVPGQPCCPSRGQGRSIPVIPPPPHPARSKPPDAFDCASTRCFLFFVSKLRITTDPRTVIHHHVYIVYWYTTDVCAAYTMRPAPLGRARRTRERTNERRVDDKQPPPAGVRCVRRILVYDGRQRHRVPGT